jgi:molybdopterin synthase catalytic subunit
MAATAPAGATLVRIQAEPFDAGREAARLAEGDAGVGAVVAFTGYCRDEGGRLTALEIEHYPGMAEAEIGRIVEAAARRWNLAGAVVVHRHGLIRPGEAIVVAAAAAAHRGDAFEAAAFMMDFLKTEAPFWKREHGPDGPGEWVDAAEHDDAARERWR